MLTIIGQNKSKWDITTTSLPLKRFLKMNNNFDKPYYAFAQNGDRIWSHHQDHYKFITFDNMIKFIESKIAYYDINYDKSDYFLNKNSSYKDIMQFLLDESKLINNISIKSLNDDLNELIFQSNIIKNFINMTNFDDIHKRCVLEEDLDIINYRINVIKHILNKIQVKIDLQS